MNISLFLTFLSLFLSGCGMQTPAPIEYNYNKVKYRGNKSNKGSEKTVLTTSEETITSSPMQSIPQNMPTNIYEDTDDKPIKSVEALKTIYHEVSADEDLETIAQNYNQSVGDIAKLNNILPGVQLSPGQIVMVQVSKEYLNKKNQQTSQEPVKENIKNNPNSAIEELDHASDQSLISPISGKVAAKFGDIVDGKVKAGVNIDCEEGSVIRAIGDGVVIHTEHNSEFGNLVIIKLRGSNTSVAYAYMKALELKKGESVKKGQTVGHVGMTGNAKKPQLYFAVREGKKAVDPEKYINP